METRYQHTQIARLILAILGVGWFVDTGVLLFLLFASGLGLSSCIGPLIVAIILPVLMILHGTLTVTLNDEFLVVRFGPGLIHKRFALKDIESCRVVRNPWYYGFGIRRLRNGWLYNVSGLDAVELKTRDGKEHRIGTDVPDELQRAITQSLSQPAQRH